jgi:hypothetical protein
MRSRELYDALRRLTVEVAELLTRELEEGAELPFEVTEQGDRGAASARSRGRPVLYRYRPLTAAFIADRWAKASELESYALAVDALGSGAGPYLRHRGMRGADPDEALRELMGRLFEDATSFSLPEERFERIHAELDATLRGTAVSATVVAPVHGVRLSSARVEIGVGLALARRSGISAPPAALEGAVRAAESTAEEEDHEQAASDASPLDVFCVLRRELEPDAPLPVDESRAQFRRVLTALRLCGAGGTALGPLAWARAGGGAWHPVALGVSTRARPESWELRHSEEQELRELLDVLALSRHSPGVGWALARFEMGCDRGLETDALSDYLLGLRALLGDPGEAVERTVAARLAALCAPDDERPSVEEDVGRAFALERTLTYGRDEGDAALSLDSPRTLVRDIEQYLRALLRDVLAGYLDEDLRRTADELLGSFEPPEREEDEIRVRDNRATAEADTAELEAVGPAVTPSVDWE